MTSPAPQGQVRPMSLDQTDEVIQLRRELESLRARPLTNAGEFTAKDPQGHSVFRTGPYYLGQFMPDGTPQWITWVRDMNGANRLVLWDPDPNADGFVQAWYIYDHLGQICFTTDNNGGWAEPHLPVVLYPKISPPGGAGVPFSYMSLTAASAGSEQSCWAGSIGYVTHSRIWIKGVWGQASGTNTATYKLLVNGSVVGTWTTVNNDLQVSTKGPFSILGVTSISAQQVDVEVRAQRTSGTGDIACQVVHCHLRQT